jgi:hypothetical protein
MLILIRNWKTNEDIWLFMKGTVHLAFKDNSVLELFDKTAA